MRAFIALGSNLQDPIGQVRAAVRDLAKLPGTTLGHCSSLYRTAPIGLTDQPDFINAVCAVDTTLSAAALMQALLATEQVHGRVRDLPGGPRTLDLDLLLYGDLACQQPGLTLPHPRLHERAFVLYPLYEIAPGLVIPGHGRIEDLLAGCGGQGVERLTDKAG